jgi:hypothetical protein
MDARTAFASSLAEELDKDMTPEFVAACDKVLMRLYMYGYIIAPGHLHHREEDE